VTDSGPTIHVSSNFGEQWTSVTLPVTLNWVVMSYTGQYQLMCHYAGSLLYSSRDYGASWTMASAPVGGFTAIAVAGGGEYMFAVSGGTIYISMDHGLTFEATSMTSANALSVSAGGAYVVFAQDSNIYQANGTVAWVPTSQPRYAKKYLPLPLLFLVH
jgi:photosystem II stability/assembly factor-like uncharacterized protein